jgi:hypothetical protein
MNLLGAPASRRQVPVFGSRLAGETPALPGTVPRFMVPMRVQGWRLKLPMNLFAADVSPPSYPKQSQRRLTSAAAVRGFTARIRSGKSLPAQAGIFEHPDAKI